MTDSMNAEFERSNFDFKEESDLLASDSEGNATPDEDFVETTSDLGKPNLTENEVNKTL